MYAILLVIISHVLEKKSATNSEFWNGRELMLQQKKLCNLRLTFSKCVIKLMCINKNSKHIEHAS